jgi:hypothetical protein
MSLLNDVYSDLQGANDDPERFYQSWLEDVDELNKIWRLEQ